MKAKCEQQSIGTFSLSKRIANFTHPSPDNNTRYLNGLGSVSMNLKVWILTPQSSDRKRDLDAIA